MSESSSVSKLFFSVLSLALVLAPAVFAQSTETKGVDSGDYHVQQTIDVGYRTTWINGNADTYDTLIDLGQGPRLFDYDLNLRSLDHNGLLFDNLSFSNFGYGGDPDDVTRLRMDKNKWYNFQALFRRDKNFSNYNLLANPLNPSSSTPSVAISSSAHALDLVRRMQDYNLTLLPQSRVSLRLGFSHDRNQGPTFFTTDGGTISAFNESYSDRTDQYHIGADFRLLPKTTISYDQFFVYFREDNVVTDNPASSGYVLSNGTPVDPGIIWSTSGPVEVLPCAAPIATAPNIFNPNCNGYLSYSQYNNPRNFMPTEHLQFQSNYLRNFETSGSLGYSSGNDLVSNFNENVNDLVTRNGTRGGTTGGPATAKRVSVNAHWAGIYSATDKFRIVDMFRYENWRIPGAWDTSEANIFGQMQPGLVGLEQPQAIFSSATFLSLCPAPYTAVTCPSHTSGSPADSVSGFTDNFLGQNIRENTIELQYDFSRYLSARVGYRYEARTIADFSATFYSAETYFPGGAGGTAANDYFAARGSCATPSACTETVDPTTGQLIALTFSGAAAGNSTARNLISINENSLLVGFTARPQGNLRITGDFEFGSNDYAFTRISPRQMQSYKIDANYKPRAWLNFDAAIDLHENRDNVSTVNDLEHGRTYGFVMTVMPKSKAYFDLGYSYTDIYTQAQICYYNNAFGPPPTTACPNSLNYTPATVPAAGNYSSTQHFAHGGVSLKLTKELTGSVGYAGTFVSGSTAQIGIAPQPAGSLAFNFQKPYASAIWSLYKGLSYRMTWNYYGYNLKGLPSNAVSGLAPIAPEDFNGSTTEFALRYSF